MTQGFFLYYLPGVKKEQITLDFISKRPEAVPFFDLVHSPRLFSMHMQTFYVENRGPDGGSGAIVAAQPVVDVPTQKTGYYPEVQEWRKVGDRYIGYQKDMVPGPESLRRHNLIEGYDVELSDKHIWHVPLIRPYDTTIKDFACGLPVVFGVDENGDRQIEVVKKYESVWRTTAAMLGYYYNKDESSLNSRFDAAVEILAVNYRIGMVEAGILQLFDTQTIEETVKASLDWEFCKQYVEGEKSGNPTTAGTPVNSDAGQPA